MFFCLKYILSFPHTCQVLSGSEWGNMLLWEGGHIKVELSRAAGKPCHQGPIKLGGGGWAFIFLFRRWLFP